MFVLQQQQNLGRRFGTSNRDIGCCLFLGGDSVVVDSLLIVTPITGFFNCSIFCYFCPFLFCDHLDGKERELAALLSLSSWCLVIVVWLFLSVPWVCLHFVIVILTYYFWVSFMRTAMALASLHICLV